MLSFIRSHKIISGVILINVIAVTWLIVAIIIHDKKTAMIDIMVAPSDAKILINGRNYDNFSSVNFLPGEYKAEISMEGMQTQIKELTLGNGEYYRLYTYLLDDKGDLKYYDTHSDDVDVLKRIASFNNDDKKLADYIERFDRIYGILDVLPLYARGDEDIYINIAGIEYDNDGNKVNNSANCDTIVCLEVYEGNKDDAEQLIIDAGYDPNDYSINYGDNE